MLRKRWLGVKLFILFFFKYRDRILYGIFSHKQILFGATLEGCCLQHVIIHYLGRLGSGEKSRGVFWVEINS